MEFLSGTCFVKCQCAGRYIIHDITRVRYLKKMLFQRYILHFLSSAPFSGGIFPSTTDIAPLTAILTKSDVT